MIKQEIDKAIEAALHCIENSVDGEETEHYANAVAKLLSAKDTFFAYDDEEDDLSDVLRDAFKDEGVRAMSRDEVIGLLRDVWKMAEK